MKITIKIRLLKKHNGNKSKNNNKIPERHWNNHLITFKLENHEDQGDGGYNKNNDTDTDNELSVKSCLKPWYQELDYFTVSLNTIW